MNADNEFLFQEEIMELLINAGEARSQAMMAIKFAREQKWDESEIAMKKSQQFSIAAHGIQTKLIGLDEGSGKVPLNLLMVHSQDHLMTAMLCQDLAKEIIYLHKMIANQSDE